MGYKFNLADKPEPKEMASDTVDVLIGMVLIILIGFTIIGALHW